MGIVPGIIDPMVDWINGAYDTIGSGFEDFGDIMVDDIGGFAVDDIGGFVVDDIPDLVVDDIGGFVVNDIGDFVVDDIPDFVVEEVYVEALSSFSRSPSARKQPNQRIE